MIKTHLKKAKFFAHSSAYLDKDVKIGAGTKIWHFSHISKGAGVGKDCRIGQGVFIGEGVKIRDRVKIQNNVSVYSGVTLEDDVFCGPSAVFTNVKNPRSEYPVGRKYAKTLVKKGASIGANATIVCGITIGRYAFIGAGSVVTKDVPDFVLAYGNPARENGWLCCCGRRMEISAQEIYRCKHCRKNYRKIQDKVVKV